MVCRTATATVGLLSLQASSYDEASTYPFDVLGAQTEGMIRYPMTELGDFLPYEKSIATILTMTLVDANDPAMADPTKFVGPVYSEADAERLAADKASTVKQDGDKWRHVVPLALAGADLRDPTRSRPCWRSAQLWSVPAAARSRRCIFPATPRSRGPRTERRAPRGRRGSEIDKDRSSAVLAQDLDADLSVIATDADAVYLDWGTPDQKAIAAVHPDALAAMADQFPAGSMGPKVEAAIDFARTGGDSYIGDLAGIDAMLRGDAGTRVSAHVDGVVYR